MKELLNKLQSIVQTILQKLQLVDSEENELDLEAAIVYIFLAICAFRALLAGATLTVNHLTWNVPDINISATLPALYAILSNSHKRYLNSKGNNDETQPKS